MTSPPSCTAERSPDVADRVAVDRLPRPRDGKKIEMTTSRKQWLLAVVGVVVIVALSACGSDDDKSKAAPKPTSQPTSQAGVFTRTETGDIPVYPGSQATGPAQRSGDTLTQTFGVSANAADISRFYTDRLSDWTPIESIAPGPNPTDPYRATWEHKTDRLTLTVDRSPREAGDNPATRYTLILSS